MNAADQISSLALADSLTIPKPDAGRLILPFDPQVS